MTDFVHLHVHSEYSALAGVSSVDALCRAARTMGYESLALTDTNGLYGAIDFIDAARRWGLRPIIGTQLVDGRRRALVLVKEAAGYSNLCRLLSARHEAADFDFVREIALYRNGLIVASDDSEALRSWKKQDRADLYVEMSPGNMETGWALSRA
ncbi:MAG TPA: PHP domain-containing protein, partial [Terriglobales bacterium]|nr:PHP domain-containing protein [Terriglobales bacterium]